MGGITFYKTFALYEEKKEFNVLKGRVPDFSGIYKESILNGAYPVLAEGLIPVEIDDTGKVTRADLASEWYSYAEKRWANAVILEDESIEYWVGDEIPESNIESYFVWIPKYSYQLWDLGNYSSLTSINSTKPHVIPVKFGTDNTSDANEGECTTPMISGASGNCKVGDYMTPPAFISMGTNGLWVGKFETGYKGATSSTGAEQNVNDFSKVQIKPNVYSWRNIQVSNAFTTSYNYKREYDSHIMKNTEWGAVAYLQHSIYGSASSVRINNNSAFITGYAAKAEPTTGYTGTNIAGNIHESTSLGVDGTNTYNYQNPLSQAASTTGNYSGIYDMSGGAYDTMMSVRGSIISGTVGYNDSNIPAERYYDLYNINSGLTMYQYRILGDATGEMGPFAYVTYSATQTRQICSWYSDEAYFVRSTQPWLNRGGRVGIGLGSGIFSFHSSEGGNEYATRSFRIVLAI